MSDAPVTHRNAQTEKLIAEGTARLLARAADARRLDANALLPRARAVLEKYLFTANAEAEASAVSEFLDALHADDLCLIVACERGDQTAWSDLVERYGATVRSAARSAAPNED